MNTSIRRVGLGLCDGLERLAPRTRPKRPSGDITASSLERHADRLRHLLEKVADTDDIDERARRRADEEVDAAVSEALAWSARVHPVGELVEAVHLVEERAMVFKRLLRLSHPSA
jgi:hypothetical protein